MEEILLVVKWALLGASILWLVLWFVRTFQNAKKLTALQHDCKKATAEETGEAVRECAVASVIKFHKKSSNNPCVLCLTEQYLTMVILDASYAPSNETPFLILPLNETPLTIQEGSRYYTVKLSIEKQIPLVLRIFKKMPATDLENHTEEAYRLASALGKYAAQQ